MVLAHPLTESAQLGVAPAFVGLLAVVIAVALGRGVAIADGSRLQVARPPDGAVTASRVGGHVLDAVGRTIGVVGLVGGIVIARLGPESQLDNIAPALFIGLGWPTLLALSALVGGVWTWLTPFDTLARGLAAITGTPSAGQDRMTDRPSWLPWVAVAGAVAVSWWLGIFIPGRDPRPLGLGLGLYTILTLVGCLLVGRQAWLADAEILGLTFGSISRARSQPPDVDGPRLIALAVLLGGLAFAEVRFSSWFLVEAERLGFFPVSAPPAVLGYVLLVTVAVASVQGARRWARSLGHVEVVDRCVPWLVVGVGLATALERNRLWTSAQLVVIQASNPFGGDVDVFGTAAWDLVAPPFGDVGLVVAQCVALVLPAGVALGLSWRMHKGRLVQPALVLVTFWVLVASLSIASM